MLVTLTKPPPVQPRFPTVSTSMLHGVARRYSGGYSRVRTQPAARVSLGGWLSISITSPSGYSIAEPS